MSPEGEREAAQPAQYQAGRKHLSGTHAVGENRGHELAEAVGDGETATDDAHVVFAKSDMSNEVRDGGREGLAAEVVRCPPDKERDVEYPPPLDETTDSSSHSVCDRHSLPSLSAQEVTVKNHHQ